MVYTWSVSFSNGRIAWTATIAAESAEEAKERGARVESITWGEPCTAFGEPWLLNDSPAMIQIHIRSQRRVLAPGYRSPLAGKLLPTA